MELKKLVQYGLMAVCLLGNAIAMEETDVLVVGCRPWDKNVESFQGFNTAHFVDFRIEGAPEPAPTKFHHLDINNEGSLESGNFSEFATTNLEKFNTVVIDWATYHHFRRDTAWTDFVNLLKSGGKLIIPVTSQSLQSGASNSKEKAEAMRGKLTNQFNQIDILTYGALPNNSSFDLLRRPSLEPGRLEYAILPAEPAIIVATKSK